MGFWTPWRGNDRPDESAKVGAPLPEQENDEPWTAGAAPVSSGQLAVTTPISQQRIAAWFTENEFHFFRDSDDDLGGIWHSRVFFFFLLGEQSEILQVRSQWNREISIERIDEMLAFCNDWNTDRIWPKAYIRVLDNGMVQPCAETSLDLEYGITDDQLGDELVCGLNSQAQLWNALDEFYPDHIAGTL